ncbi:MAG TPA: HD domain-containing protein [Anaerolineaceae bacterium]|mgnify:CR=1 FL=1|nr:HD domain-containing protein [Anaerolineaceae bacterium]HPN53953.1 HD domain-containing protein [Anaerolineaceae bacterium]
MEDADLSLLFKAFLFSSVRHRDQRRKDQESSPYINHPIEVMELVWRVGGVRSPAVLMAALLHDTIEDTQTTPEEIETIFGKEVLDLVLELTDDKSLPKAERKHLQVMHAPHKSAGARPVKIADKICNVHDISHSPPLNWTWERCMEYIAWSEQVVNGMRGMNPELEALFDQNAAEAYRLLEQHHETWPVISKG